MAIAALAIALLNVEEGDRGRRGRKGEPGPPGPPGANNGTKYGFEWSIPTNGALPNEGAGYYALSNDPTFLPNYYPSTYMQSYFLPSRNLTLTSVHLSGNITYYGTFNSIQGSSGPYPIPLLLYVNTAFVAILASFPASSTTYDVIVSGLSYPISNQDDMSFVVDLTQWVNGSMGAFIVGVGFQETASN